MDSIMVDSLESEDAFFASLARFAACDFASSLDDELCGWMRATSVTVQEMTVPDVGLHVQHDQQPSGGAPRQKRLRLTQQDQYYSDRNDLELRPSVEEELTLDDASYDSESPSDRRHRRHLQPNGSSASLSSSNATTTIGQSGEMRLRINFTSYGQIGSVPQHFGKSGSIIPNGLSGTHEMYDQMWKFDIIHEFCSKEDIVLIKWKITNITSGMITCVTETPRQASLRESSGRTICNKVVKMALDNRAVELEQALPHLLKSAEKEAVEVAIHALRPKLCTVGLLFFGLLHETVQNRVV